MSNDEQHPSDPQSRDFATRKLSDPGATVNLNADEIAAIREGQASAPATHKLDDPGATISFRAGDVPGLSDQQAQGQPAAKDAYATVNLSAEEAAQFRAKMQQPSADVTQMAPSDIVPPAPPIEGPSMTREIGEPLPAGQQSSSTAAPDRSPPAAQPAPPNPSPPYQGSAQPAPPNPSPPYQGSAQPAPPNPSPPYQGYAQPGPPREAIGPGNPGHVPVKSGMSFGPAQILIGIGTLLILVALVLVLL